MAFNKYPYTDFSDYNLDWIISEIKKLHKDWSEFEILNTIRFEGVWDITKQYPAWSLVTDDNVGYISIQPVPAGIDISENDYWREVYNYSTIIPDIMNRIVALENDVTNIDNVEIPGLNGRVDDLETNILPPMISQLTVLSKRRILIFGDSYFTDTPAGYVGTNFRTFLTSMLANVPNVEFDLSADGGERFSLDPSYSFSHDIENFVSIFNPDEVTDIFFVGGYNDRNSTGADINAGIVDAFGKAHAKYKNAKISVGHFGWSATLASTDRDNIVNYSLRRWIESTRYGSGYMTNAEYTMHDYNLFCGDNFHPTEDGTREIAAQIVNYIISGTCDVHYPFTHIYFNRSGYPTAANTSTQYDIAFQLDNDIVSFYLPEANISFTTSIAMSTSSFSQTLQLCTTSAPNRGYALGRLDSNSYWWQTFPVIGYLQQSPAVFLPLSECQCAINGGFLHIRPNVINASQSSFATVNNITNMRPIAGVVTIPTLWC